MLEFLGHLAVLGLYFVGLILMFVVIATTLFQYGLLAAVAMIIAVALGILWATK
jgi:hypothetical protein